MGERIVFSKAAALKFQTARLSLRERDDEHDVQQRDTERPGTVTVANNISGPGNLSQAGGGTLRLDLPASGVTFTAPSGGGIRQTQQNALIVDLNTPWVTIGDNDWAAKDATIYNAGNPASSVNIVRGSSIGGFYTPSSGGTFTGNLDIDNSPAIAATSVLGSMRFNAAGANTVTVAAGAFLEPHGILVGTGVGAADVTIAGPGSIRGTDDATNAARDLPVIQNNTAGNLVITAPIVNFDADAHTTLVKSGAGDVNVSAGAILIGTGTIGGAGGIIGTVAPGLTTAALLLLGALSLVSRRKR